MATPQQYQAKQMSMDWNAVANQGKQYASEQYAQMLKDSKAWAERSAQESAKQRTSDETRSMYDANSRVNSSIAGAQGQVGAAAENSRAAIMAQELERDKFNINKNATMGLDAVGNVQNRAIDNGGGNAVQTRGDSMFGKYGVSSFVRGGTTATAAGMQDNWANQSAMRDYEYQRGQAATTARMISEGEAAGDIARTKAQSREQRNNMLTQNNLDINRMNREASLKGQADANARAVQSREADKDRANQRYLAGLDANTRLFASLNQGQGGFQYWGGSI